MISAGKLDREVSIGMIQTAIGPGGTPTLALFETMFLRAQLVEEAIAEHPAGAGIATTHSITFRTRYAAISTKQVLQFASDLYDITEIREIGRRRGLEIRCVRRPC
ncbi:hypothetical protein FHS85_001960 [Rhodoligotrophos appendicifer]|uniref:phage head completion protein n=1 Tax=Rhodoligotrophos appendicifer TaxID=987056 RepID=UPI001478E8B1|nr:head-tail adaptor protein [Rhodoligotrophos appendicifer]